MDSDGITSVQLPAAPFPGPPPFWKYFTVENVEKAASADSTELLSTAELAYCRPPPPPPESAESYTAFAIPQSLNPVPLPPPAEILLFDPKSPDFNPANTLSRITKSLLLNFLELATILGNDPVQYEEKLDDVQRLMHNVHFVINMYRPHQAREGVREMLQARLLDGKSEIQRCDDLQKKVEIFLNSVEQSQNEVTQNKMHDMESLAQRNVEGRKLDESKKLWELINT